MAEKNVYDDIIECLRNVRKTAPVVSVSADVMQEFMTDYPREHKIETPQIIQPQEIVQSPAPQFPHSEIQEPAPDTAISSMDWESLHNAANCCQACKLCTTRQHVVFEDGIRQARLLFFGEGPGADEDAQGVPFVGRAGQLLTKMIEAMQFRRDEVYICNTVKCRPPGNRNPEPDELAACRSFALRQIELVHPQVIVALGAVALRFLFPQVYGGIRNLRGHWMMFNDIQVMPTYHPAYLLRDPMAKRDAWADLQQVMAVFGKLPPAKRQV